MCLCLYRSAPTMRHECTLAFMAVIPPLPRMHACVIRLSAMHAPCDAVWPFRDECGSLSLALVPLIYAISCDSCVSKSDMFSSIQVSRSANSGLSGPALQRNGHYGVPTGAHCSASRANPNGAAATPPTHSIQACEKSLKRVL